MFHDTCSANRSHPCRGAAATPWTGVHAALTRARVPPGMTPLTRAGASPHHPQPLRSGLASARGVRGPPRRQRCRCPPWPAGRVGGGGSRRLGGPPRSPPSPLPPLPPAPHRCCRCCLPLLPSLPPSTVPPGGPDRRCRPTCATHRIRARRATLRRSRAPPPRPPRSLLLRARREPPLPTQAATGLPAPVAAAGELAACCIARPRHSRFAWTLCTCCPTIPP